MQEEPKGEVVIYRAKSGKTSLEVSLKSRQLLQNLQQFKMKEEELSSDPLIITTSM
jgi:hypothetical protein